MLVFTRKRGENIVIGNAITVTVVEIQGGKVRLAIEAPREIPIRRTEILSKQPDRPAGGVAADQESRFFSEFA